KPIDDAKAVEIEQGRCITDGFGHFIYLPFLFYTLLTLTKTNASPAARSAELKCASAKWTNGQIERLSVPAAFMHRAAFTRL
ncbi:MAG: hypothetical protein PHD58_03860, partial [Anaerolineales bacterium]|nr:hypothetical protein [Anaerolineales bacterium]